MRAMRIVFVTLTAVCTRPHHYRHRRARLPLPLDRARSPSSSPSHLDLDRRFGAVDLDDPLYPYDEDEEARGREKKERAARLWRKQSGWSDKMERRRRSGKRQLEDIQDLLDDAVAAADQSADAVGQVGGEPTTTTTPASPVNSVSTAQGGLAGTFPTNALATAPGAAFSSPLASSSVPPPSSAPVPLETITLSSSDSPSNALATSVALPAVPPSDAAVMSPSSSVGSLDGGTQTASANADGQDKVVSTGLLTAGLVTNSDSAASLSVSTGDRGEAEANAAAISSSAGEHSSSSPPVQTNARGATVTRFSTAPAATVEATGLAQGAGEEGNGAAESLVGREVRVAVLAVAAMFLLI
ncbi:hypothetical protein JCM11251_006279 [Rhodosporidiobolus azoricus]